MKEKYICSDLVKLWSALLMAIVLMLSFSEQWEIFEIILVCSIGGVLIFYAAFLIMILLLSLLGIEVVDKNQYEEWLKQRRKNKSPKVFSYALYGWILTFAALICGALFADYQQNLGAIIFEWIVYGSLAFLIVQIIMRIIFLTWNITTDKGDIEAMAHEIERRRAEKKELKKLRKAERRRQSSWLRRAFYRGLGFGAGWSIFSSGNNNNGS